MTRYGIDWQATHQHRKGGYYEELARAVWEADNTPVVVYQASDASIWVRSAAEFDDGRFTRIAPSRFPFEHGLDGAVLHGVREHDLKPVVIREAAAGCLVVCTRTDYENDLLAPSLAGGNVAAW